MASPKTTLPRPISIGRAKVVSPAGTFTNVRFVYKDGRAAVWKEGKKTSGAATRLLYAEDAEFTRAQLARHPHVLTTGDGEEWHVTQIAGGCGCGSTTKRIPLAELLDPDVDSIG